MMSKISLPRNAVRCSRIERIHCDRLPLGGPDLAVATIRGQKHLASWGGNFTRADVETFAARNFVFTGMVGVPGETQSESYEELY